MPERRYPPSLKLCRLINQHDRYVILDMIQQLAALADEAVSGII